MNINNQQDNIQIVTFYKFAKLDNYSQLQQPIKDFCSQRELTGTILLSNEGLNATVAGELTSVAALLDYLQSINEIGELVSKFSYTDNPPFSKIKVRLKQEAVALGLGKINVEQYKPHANYVGGKAWNQLIKRPDVLTIDVRNWYESSLGTFDGALHPRTETFKQFPEYVKDHLNSQKHKKIAMYCTGGIRCEKAAAYMAELGFSQIYQLDGGILNYLSKVGIEDSLWRGNCFVFDDRVAVDHKLQPVDYSL